MSSEKTQKNIESCVLAKSCRFETVLCSTGRSQAWQAPELHVWPDGHGTMTLVYEAIGRARPLRKARDAHGA
jgi:hypothetical protein